MARALDQIMAELESVYSPQRDVYSQQINALPGQEQAQLGGLEASKTDSFNQITQGANRRGVAFGGIPLAEQASYLGQSYLPAVANLKGKFTGLKGDLSQRLAELGSKQRMDAYGIRDYELAQDARTQAAASGGGGGSGGSSFNFSDPYALTGEVPQGATPQQGYIGNNDFRGRLAYEANQGDSDARVMLKYVGNNNRYDGPVSSLQELQTLRNNGVEGNYYVAGLQQQGSPSGLSIQGGGGSIPTTTGSTGGGLRLL